MKTIQFIIAFIATICAALAPIGAYLLNVYLDKIGWCPESKRLPCPLDFLVVLSCIGIILAMIFVADRLYKSSKY